MLSLASAIVADAMQLIDQRTLDGSRHFAYLPQAVTWATIRDHTLRLPDAKIVKFVEEGLATAWLDFRFCRHRFLIDARNGRFRLFVRNPLCPDLILYRMGQHFEQLLLPRHSD